MHDDLYDFARAMASRGLILPADLVPDGKVHRFSTNAKIRDTAGWYVLNDGAQPDGHAGDFRSGEQYDWVAKRAVLHASELAEQRQRAAARNAEKLIAQNEARDTAARMWNRARQTTSHLYTFKKKVRCHGTRIISGGQYDGWLAVPMHDIEGCLWNLELIAPTKPKDGQPSKRSLANGRRDGLFFTLGNPGADTPICVCEGFATGATVFEATGLPTAVAFSSNNLKAVAMALQQRFPRCLLAICADDDVCVGHNPGMVKAAEAADAVGGLVIAPTFGGERSKSQTDFNDMARAQGSAAVRDAIDLAIRQRLASTSDCLHRQEKACEAPQTTMADIAGATVARFVDGPSLETVSAGLAGVARLEKRLDGLVAEAEEEGGKT